LADHKDVSARSGRDFGEDDLSDARSLSSHSVRTNRTTHTDRSGSKSVRSIRSVRSEASKRAKKAQSWFETPLEEYKRPESPTGSQAWRSLAYICTFFIPDTCIPKNSAQAKQAWR